ncbi:MAG: HAMP domain-containing sensor histidine kinase [Flavitalea sp.]
MKTKKFNPFRRVTLFIFILIASLSVFFIGITYLAATNFYQASTQNLNRNVASYIAEFASPFGPNGINKAKADSVFENAMVISPGAEIYFLDTTGKVVSFYAERKEIKSWLVPLDNIHKLIKEQGRIYIKNLDPKDPLHPKIFSASEVYDHNRRKLGYIYVIIGSLKYRDVSDMLFDSHVGYLAAEAFTIIILLSILISLLYIRYLKKGFNSMITVLENFEHGDFDARFSIRDHDEMLQVKQAFNKMADLLNHNFNKLIKSEKERKDFIANISHDLRTPLAVVRGFIETLIIKQEGRELTKEQQQEYLELSATKIQQVEKMVRQLFELSRMDSAEFEPKKEPFIFSEILQECINASLIAASLKNISIDYKESINNVWINADISMMERVVQNLIDNAIHYTPENGEIKVDLHPQAGSVIFTIQNSGEALSRELIDWMNTVDHQIVSLKPSKKGLGLSIIKKILHLHEYPVSVKSDKNRNSISFLMPVYDSKTFSSRYE